MILAVVRARHNRKARTIHEVSSTQRLRAENDIDFALHKAYMHVIRDLEQTKKRHAVLPSVPITTLKNELTPEFRKIMEQYVFLLPEDASVFMSELAEMLKQLAKKYTLVDTTCYLHFFPEVVCIKPV